MIWGRETFISRPRLNLLNKPIKAILLLSLHELAIPYNNNLPPQLSKCGIVFIVSDLVLSQLIPPKLFICFGAKQNLDNLHGHAKNIR